MDNRMQILQLLAEKQQLFSEIEKMTEDLCAQQVDELVQCMEKRGELLEQIKVIDCKIEKNCGEELRPVLHHACARGDLSQDLVKYYDAALAIKAIANRIIKNEDGVRLHLESEKQRIAKKLEELNHSGFSVANQYHRSVETGVNQALWGGTDKMI